MSRIVKVVCVAICVFLGLFSQQIIRDRFDIACINPVGSKSSAVEYIELFLQHNNNQLPLQRSDAYTFANTDTDRNNVVAWEFLQTKARRYTTFRNELSNMEFDHGYSIWIDATFDDGETHRVVFSGGRTGILICPFAKNDLGFSSPATIETIHKQ